MKRIKFNIRKMNEDRQKNDDPKDFITDEEVVLKRDLINILKDDGKGHHHALYAKVLEMFPPGSLRDQKIFCKWILASGRVFNQINVIDNLQG